MWPPLWCWQPSSSLSVRHSGGRKESWPSCKSLMLLIESDICADLREGVVVLIIVASLQVCDYTVLGDDLVRHLLHPICQVGQRYIKKNELMIGPVLMSLQSHRIQTTSRSGMQSSSAAMGWSLEVKQRNNKFGTVGTLFQSTESRTSVFTQPSTMVVMILPQSWQLYPSNPMLYKQNEVVPAFPIVNVYVCPCLNCCDIFGILYNPKVGGSWSKYIRLGTFCNSLVIFPLYPARTEL